MWREVHNPLQRAAALCLNGAKHHAEVKTFRKAGERKLQPEGLGGEEAEETRVCSRLRKRAKKVERWGSGACEASQHLRPRCSELEGTDRGCSITAETPERSWTQLAIFYLCDPGWLLVLPLKTTTRMG